jgi:hypothetical protein
MPQAVGNSGRGTQVYTSGFQWQVECSPGQFLGLVRIQELPKLPALVRREQQPLKTQQSPPS